MGLGLVIAEHFFFNIRFGFGPFFGFVRIFFFGRFTFFPAFFFGWLDWFFGTGRFWGILVGGVFGGLRLTFGGFWVGFLVGVVGG